MLQLLGRLEEIEVKTSLGTYCVPFKGAETLVTDDGRTLLLGGVRGSLLDALRLGWRPWRRSVGRVISLTYRTRRFLITRRGYGYLNPRAAELARRWGAPAYMHFFEDACLVMGFSGRLWISGSYTLDRTRAGEVGSIRG